MRRWLLVSLAVFIVSACSGQTVQPQPAAVKSPPEVVVSPAATPTALGPVATAPPVDESSPSPSPTPPPANGVLVDLLSAPSRYTISVVDTNGRIVKQLTAGQRSTIDNATGRAATLPYVSTTASSLYYLDGDATVKVWRMDGTAGQPIALDLASGMEAAFAVSPDDRTIAVSVLDFNRGPVHLTLYTDAVGGGSKRAIFESDSDYVWPVAWHNGLIVLAHALGPFEGDITKEVGRVDPYSAISYHLIDPITAKRVVLMGACTVSGPLSPAGSGCVQGGSIDWQGNTTDWSTTDWGGVSAAASLSPDGQWMAAARPDAQSQTAIWRHSDGQVVNQVDGPGPREWAGWLDGETILVGSYTDPGWQPFVVNVVSGGIVHVVPAHGFFAALLPTNLG